jgi:excisionase family DNA binding protein
VRGEDPGKSRSAAILLPQLVSSQVNPPASCLAGMGSLECSAVRGQMKVESGHPPELQTTKEVAAYLRIANGTVYEWVRLGILPCRRVGRQLRFTWEDVDEVVRRSDSLGAGLAPHLGTKK